ncbi:alpha-hydroxy-acid oxidizing protein [Siccirubricoccus sp. KC 17139]|uniref:Alpha-hydroxy-acid oxidizing protein n=1 Tax=Siccirubricoccus soli TaxID=2899147 RepID=A0ABT1DAI6_9PROT|nr:alpha-hydroxy acid oxidase [Siccirubricoccus soli]MCO6418938.1 alpha-hydroxy-acid oxidizing protein [Siccirubricoccus soli]MCP2685073.1 alpha-hydroxy-acid oxidizing protein [Siccirubricoccus soli]
MSTDAESPFQTLHEFVKEAKSRLSPGNWDYLVGATETETTMLRNRAAIDALAFRPRVLRDVSSIDLSGRFLGRRITLPVMLAPVGGLENFDPEGGAPAARAAAAYGVPIMVSSVSMPGLEPMAQAGKGPKVFQLYVRGDGDWIDEIGKRAIDAGYDAFCFTVDTAIYSRRERDIAKRFVKPWRVRATGQHFQAALNWDDIKRFKDRFPNIPVVLKGIATAEDALLAVEHGVEVVYVSNHGGRQLDHGRGAIAVLPEVVKAVNGRAKVWVDGGFSRGTDVVKAIILGAELVGLGRLYCYALAAAGEAGVARMLELLATEVHEVLGLLGVTSFGQLDGSYLHPVEPLVTPHVHSAFPLTNLSDPGYR